MKIPWQAPEEALTFHYLYKKAFVKITLRSINKKAHCPHCQKVTMRIHSHYRRTIQDLPVGEDTILIELIARKWFCDTPECATKIFTERFDWLLPYSRRTERLTTVLRKLAFSTSCLSAEKVARAFHIQISHDTLLTILKNTEIPVHISEAIGLDDFAFKKGNDYGTLICDFRTHRPVAILPDRVTNIVKDWLIQRHNFKW